MVSVLMYERHHVARNVVPYAPVTQVSVCWKAWKLLQRVAIDHNNLGIGRHSQKEA